MNPQQDEAPDDLHAQLSAAFEAAEPTAETGEVVPPSEPVEDAPEAGAPAASGDRLRDATGKFAKSTDKAAPEKAAPTEIPSTDAAKASEQPASTPAIAPPAGWTAAEKAEWSKLPPAIQTAVSRREAEISRGGQQWSEEKRRYESVLAPVAQSASRYGMTAEQGLNALMDAQRRLETDPVSALRHLAQIHGVNLATLAGQAPAEGSSDAPQQPDIQALVRQAVAPMLAPIQQRMQAEADQREQSTVNLVTEFASSPGHEHFGEVQNEIMAMIPQVRAMNPTWTNEKVLQDAYDRAVWANPSTRSALTDAQIRAANEKRDTEAKARAAKARTASVSLTGAPVGSNGSEPKDSIRAELEAAFAGH